MIFFGESTAKRNGSFFVNILMNLIFYKFFMEKIYKKSFTECETEFAQMDNYKGSLEFGKIN